MKPERNEWVEEYAYLWESGEWGLHHTHYSCTKVTLRFRNSSVSAADFVALRQLIPKFTEHSLSTLWSDIKGKREIALGEFGRSEAHRLAEKAIAIGLQLQIENTSYDSYLPINIGKELALVIEDKQIADQVTEMMLKRGVPIIQYAEAD